MDGENPLEQPAPEDPIERIHVLARDLAYGSVHGYWGTKITSVYSSDGEDWFSFFEPENDEYSFNGYLSEKWNDSHPNADLMESFEFFRFHDEKPNQLEYLLTSKAFALLEKPVAPPSVFISYRQEESSALALLVEARLKLADEHTNTFVDKLIEPSDSLGTQIQNAIEHCRFFICLLGPTTLIESEMVRQEIELAHAQKDCIIIPICHNHFVFDGVYNEHFGDTKAVVIDTESAEEYELAITKLLLKMGYSTI